MAGHTAIAQEVFIGDHEKIVILDLSTCQFQEIPIGTLEGAENNTLSDLAFHPNGKLYIATSKDIVVLDPVTWEPEVLQSWTENPQAQYLSMAINEKGDFVVGGVHGHIYDWRRNRFEAHYLTDPFIVNPFGFLNDRLLDLNLNRQVFSTSTLENLADRDTFWNFTGSEFAYYSVTKTHSSCGGTLFVSQAFSVGPEQELLDHYLLFDESTRTIDRLCYTPDGSPLRTRGLAAVDDFRRNGLLLDLDGDNSSFHRTGGYYDTLTNCDPVGRLSDEDIEFRLCGGNIDSIVFEMKYFTDPALDREELISEVGQLEPSGPGKWIWHNPYGSDTHRVEDFLKSIRYEADWPEAESHERIVVTTAWIDGESTSSWTVLQLIGTGELAGQDSTAYYCNSTDAINLSRYLSEGVNASDGNFVPRPSGGQSLFIPGVDPDSTYLFIVDKYGCPDTAVITVEGRSSINLKDTLISYCEGESPILLSDIFPGMDGYTEPAFSEGGLEFDPAVDQPGVYQFITGDNTCADTAEVLFEYGNLDPVVIPRIRLCRGGSQKIGVPPGLYDRVEWWNGDTGDSTIIDLEGMQSSAWVLVTSGSCSVRTDIEVQVVLGSISFPPWVNDTVYLCTPDESFRIRSGMDSLIIDGTDRYAPDDEILLEPGLHVMTGYYNRCLAEKEIWVELADDLGMQFSREMTWCPGDALDLSLPADSAGLQFSWSDGHPGLSREVTKTGDYIFEVRNPSCTYTGMFSILQANVCKDCEVSIPNAVSPNGDGINEDLRIYTSGCGVIRSARLMDKWGNVLYQTTAMSDVISLLIPALVWQDLAPGWYLLSVDYEDTNGQLRTESGTVMVIR